MTVSMAGFTINDAVTKAVVDEMNIGQLVLVRGLFAAMLMGLFAWQQGALRSLRDLAHPVIAFRTFCEAAATLCFITALSRLPLATVSAILQALPLVVTMGAALFFSEPVGWRRWAAIFVGLIGVLVILRPGFEGFNAFTLLVLGAVAFSAARDLVTRLVPQRIPSAAVSLATAITVSIMGAALVMPLGGWTPMTTNSVGLLFLAAILLLFGYQFIIMAMRAGEISAIAPFRYTALLWAIGLGIVMFGEFPDLVTVAGAVIVVGSGLYTIYREQVRSRQRPVAASTSPSMAPDGL
jgi:drug/metabolite transporter (DMT)-like permease